MAWLRRRAASASMRAPEALSRHVGYRLRAQGAGAAAWARRRAAILSMRAASMPAPKPLSTLTVHTPGEHDVSAASSGVRPCSAGYVAFMQTHEANHLWQVRISLHVSSTLSLYDVGFV